MKLGSDLSARLCHRPQARELHTVKTKPVKHLIGVRNSAERGSALFLEKIPKFLLHETLICQKYRRANKKMRIYNRKTVHIIHRKRSDRAFGVIKLKIFGDRLRIIEYIGI